MVTFFAVAVLAMLAGVIHSATGFGAGIFMMLFFPSIFGMIPAPALSSAIVIGLEGVLAWDFRKYIDWKLCLLPTLVYVLFSVTAIGMVNRTDMDALTFAYGLFLIALAIYFFAFSAKLKFRANWLSATICGGISGIASGFFGIGGPLMAVYFVSATEDKESYLANLQFLFTVTSVVNLITRIVNGIYTLNLLPLTLVGLAGILVGKVIGLKILNCLEPDRIRRIVYAFVGISGVITVLK